MNEERRIILASGSPRRLDLMKRIGFLPRVVKSDIPEERKERETPQDYTERLALEKALAVLDVPKVAEGTEMWILSADTIVTIDDLVLEKPVDESDAKRMLTMMSGRTHKVITSFCWKHRTQELSEVVSVIAEVEMIPFDEEMVDAYIKTGESMDKAGAYGIQAIGATLVRGVNGSYFSVMGLPVCEVVESLKRLKGLTTFPFPDIG